MTNDLGKPLPRILAAVVFLWPGWLGGQEKTPAAEPPPIRALLITGGASHDYGTRKEILVQGIRERVKRRIEWVVRHEGDGESDVQIPVFKGSGWADGYDIVVHDYCFPRVTDLAYVDRILAPHRAGLPAVLVHGTMHSFRTGDDAWFEFCGATSRRHGRPQDFSVEPAPGGNPIIAGMTPWTVPRGELYLIERLHSGSTPLTLSQFTDGEGEDQATTWSHLYGPAQARVFATTLGNETPTLLTPAFLDLLAKGFLWALDDLREENFTLIPAEESLASLKLEEPEVPLPRPGPSLATGGRTNAMTTSPSPLLGAEMAIDGDPMTYWEADSPGPSSWQLDMRREREVGAVTVIWKDVAPQRYEVEGSRDGLSWRVLLETTGQGMMPVSTGFDPRPMRFLRVSVSATEPGFIPGIREIAVYGHMDDLPAAFPDFVSINGAPRVVLSTSGAGDWERAIRLAAGWALAGQANLPGVDEIIQIIPTASGEAYLLAQMAGGDERVVYLARPDATGTITFRKFLDSLPDSSLIAYDGEWVYTLDGFELSAYRDSNGDGLADDRARRSPLLSMRDARAQTSLKYSRFRAGPDGWFYAVAETVQDVAGFNSQHELIRLPRHGLVRFRGTGEDFEVHAASDSAPDDFYFGRTGEISLRTISPDGEMTNPRIFPLPPLPGRAWQEIPPLAWPPSLVMDPRWENLEAVPFRDRFYMRESPMDFPQIAEIAGVGQAVADGALLWFSREENDETGIGLVRRVGGPDRGPVKWDGIATKDLFSLLSSAVPSVRTEGGYEILRRKYNPRRELERIIESNDTIAHASAMAVLSALGGDKTVQVLIEAGESEDPAKQALAFRHLGDHPDLRNHRVLGEISDSTVPTVTAAILSAMERTGTNLRGLDSMALSLAHHPDVTLAATARAFLQTRGAAAVCFEVLDDESKEESWPTALAVLSGIRRATVVEDLVLRLEKTRSARFRALGIGTMLDLYYDDRVNRHPWEGTALVDLFLRASLHDHRVDRAALLSGMSSAGIPPPPPATLVGLAVKSIPLEAYAVNTLSADPALSGGDLPLEGFPWLESIVDSPDRDPGLRHLALGLLAAHGAGEDYRRLFDKVAGFAGEEYEGDMEEDLLRRWLSRKDHSSDLSWLVQQSGNGSGAKAALAWVTILDLLAKNDLPDADRDRLRDHLDSTLATAPAGTRAAPLIAAVPFAGEAEAATIFPVLPRLGDGSLQEPARKAILERALRVSKRATVADLDTEMLAGYLADRRGDPIVGRHLFRQLACDACHNIHGEGPSSGPDLANSPRLASLPDLIDSVLVRRAVAPSRDAGIFELNGGRRLAGYDKIADAELISLRDRAGNPFSLDPGDVKLQLPLDNSAMVCDSAGLLSVDDFASLLDYLRSLAP